MKLLFYFIFLLLLSQLSWGQNNNTTNSSSEKEISIEKNSENEEEKKETTPKELVPILEKSEMSIPSKKKQAQILQLDQEVQFNQVKDFNGLKQNYLSKQKAYTEQRTTRTYTANQLQELENLLREISSQKAASFESLFFYYLNGQYDLNRSTALLTAEKMNNSDAQIALEMAIYYYLLNDVEKTRSTLKTVFHRKIFSDDIYSYAEDVLLSMPENGILLTHGREDGLSALYVQRVLRKREDVTVISLDWLNSPQYVTRLKSEKGLFFPPSKEIDVYYLERFCTLNESKGISIALTIPKEYFLPILSNLFVSGLVFEYREVQTDNHLQNEKLWNTTLKKQLLESKNHDLVLNYIPMMLQLGKRYEIQDKINLKQNLDNQINDLLQSRGKILK